MPLDPQVAERRQKHLNWLESNPGAYTVSQIMKHLYPIKVVEEHYCPLESNWPYRRQAEYADEIDCQKMRDWYGVRKHSHSVVERLTTDLSEATLRNDLNILEKYGKVNKFKRGGMVVYEAVNQVQRQNEIELLEQLYKL